jgi:hypothetical protein
MASARLQGDSERATAPGVLPPPQQLAALGTVLCLYRLQHGSELSGWTQAAYAEAAVGVDSDGLRESVRFFDCEGRCCWRLHLLPDSDFLAWDRMMTSLPHRQEAAASHGVAERLWRRLAGRLRGGDWRACVVRLYALTQAGASPVLAASLAAVSPLGAATARRIIDAEGVEAEIASVAQRRVPPAGAAAIRHAYETNARPVGRQLHEGGGNVLPLVKLGTRKQP